MGLLFSSNEWLNGLNESAELFVDGIFSGIATVFVLCESRTKVLYRAIWKKIIKLAPMLQNNVKFIMVDYEKAAIATLQNFSLGLRYMDVGSILICQYCVNGDN
ncbi:hypothetical protein ACS0PU_012516 [Formica fusca]